MHFCSLLNNMDKGSDGESQETRLKKAALACAHTCSEATGFVCCPDPPPKDAESLDDKVRRRRKERSDCKWDESDGQSGKP